MAQKLELDTGQKVKKAADLVEIAVAAARAFAGDFTGVAVEGVKHFKLIIGVAAGIVLLPIFFSILVIFSVVSVIGGVGGSVMQEQGSILISEVVADGYGAYLSQAYHDYEKGGNAPGVDIAAPIGTPVYALYSGSISYYLYLNNSGNLCSFGACAFLFSGNRKVVYAHLSQFDTEESRDTIATYSSTRQFSPDRKLFVKTQAVSKGDVIGYVGNTGNSSGAHLHFGILIDGYPVNPLEQIPQEQGES